MIYTHVLGNSAAGTRSPLEQLPEADNAPAIPVAAFPRIRDCS
jgi:hypothetical protein